MLDNVDTAAKSEDLAEHKVKSELDRLADLEIARMRRAIAAKERRVQAAEIGAALASPDGTRYTAAELAAACGAAIALALKSTRGMRLTADDWSDLRGSLMTAAIEHGRRRNLERGEGSTLAAADTCRAGCAGPAAWRVTLDAGTPGVTATVPMCHRHARPHADRRPILAAAAPGASNLPRRRDLAAADKSEGLAYLTGAARRLVADLAAKGAADREHTAAATDDTPDPHPDRERPPLAAADLAAALAASKRETAAIRVACGESSAELAAETGKTLGAMRQGTAKGRATLAARLTPAAIREAATAALALPQDGAVTLAGRTVPADLAERALAALRATADLRRNVKPPTWRGYLTTDRPMALVITDGRAELVPAHGPVNVRHLAADLPTLRPARVAGAAILRRRAAALAPSATLPVRPWRPSPGAPVSGWHDLAAVTEYVRPDTGEGHTPHGGWNTGDVDRGGPTVSGGRMQAAPRRAWGAFTPEVLADLNTRRTADLAARRAAREDLRTAAETAGKLTVLPPAPRS